MLTELSKDEVLMAAHKVFGHICPTADPGQGKNRSRGVPFFEKNFFRLKGYNNKPNA